MADQLVDPYRAYTFRVKVSGMNDSQFHFTKCSAFSVTVENKEYVEAGNELVTRQVPTRVKYEPITLSYGVTDSRDLWDWLMKAAAGKVERKNVSVFVRDSDGSSTKEHWELVAAWPQKWQGWEMDAASGDIAIAQLTLVYEQLKRGRN